MDKAPPPSQNAFASLDLQTQISEVLKKSIDEEQWYFFVNKEELDSDQVAGQNCLLPVLLWDAYKSHRLAFPNSDVDIQFIPDGSAFVGARAKIEVPEEQARASLIMTALHPLIEAIKKYDRKPDGPGPTLDHLVNQFFLDHENQALPWAPGSEPAEPNLSWMRNEPG